MNRKVLVVICITFFAESAFLLFFGSVRTGGGGGRQYWAWSSFVWVWFWGVVCCYAEALVGPTEWFLNLAGVL